MVSAHPSFACKPSASHDKRKALQGSRACMRGWTSRYVQRRLDPNSCSCCSTRPTTGSLVGYSVMHWRALKILNSTPLSSCEVRDRDQGSADMSFRMTSVDSARRLRVCELIDPSHTPAESAEISLVKATRWLMWRLWLSSFTRSRLRHRCAVHTTRLIPGMPNIGKVESDRTRLAISQTHASISFEASM